MMNERLTKAFVALLAVASIGACAEAPVDLGDEGAERLQTNPSSVAVDAGDTTYVDAYLVTALGQPLLGDATYQTCNATIATTVEDDTQTELEPGTRFGIVGQSIGSTCVLVSAGGFTDSVFVRVVAAGFSVTGNPDSIRAGTAGDINIAALNAAGANVGPFSETDATFTSSRAGRLFFTDDMGGFDTDSAGPVDVTIAWTTQGITRDTVISLVVIPDVPDSVRMSATSFGAVAAGDTTSRTLVVLDSTYHNVNRLPQDLISVSSSSDNTAVATTYAELVEDPARPGEFVPTIYAIGVAEGSTTIDVTLETVSGTFTVNNVPVTVVNPVITAITPNSGRPGEVVTISGTGFTAAGLTTTVQMNGTNITMFVDNITSNAITLDMPAWPANGAQEITVSVGVVASDPATWTQTSMQDVRGPANESFSTAPAVTFPIDLAGTLFGTNIDDWYSFTIAAPTQLTFRLDWTGGKDLDILFRNTGGALVCSVAGASANHPENASCTINTPGTYIIQVDDYSNAHDHDESLVTYELRGTATLVP